MTQIALDSFYPVALDALPRAWEVCYIGDIISDIHSGFASGVHNAEGRGVAHLRPMNVSRNGNIDLSDVKYVADERGPRLLQGDILFNNTNSPELIGKTAPYDLTDRLAFSNHMTRLRPPQGVNHHFAAYQLHYLWMAGFFLHKCVEHVNQASVSSRELGNSVPFVLPPIPEQHRIVAFIEQQFSRLDAAVTNLKRARTNLKRYQASVLKAACEGRLMLPEAELARSEGRDYEPASVLMERILTERRVLREAAQQAKRRSKGQPSLPGVSPSRYEEPPAPDTSGLPEPPEGWEWATIGQLSWRLQYGTSAKADDEPTGVPVLRMGNIQEGTVDFAHLKFLPEAHQDVSSTTLEPGDLLFNRTNSAELVGKTAVYAPQHPRACFASYLIRVSFAHGVEPRYVATCINSYYGRQYVGRVQSQQVGQANVSGTKLSNMPIPVPPQAEQTRIVAEFERRLSGIQVVKQAIEVNLKRAERLRHAILKHAFEGRLVPQDPNDELASVLLERIKVGRVAVAGARPTRQRRETPTRRKKQPALNDHTSVDIRPADEKVLS